MEHPIVIDSQGKLWKSDKQSVIARMISSPAGKIKLAAAMVRPIKTCLDYQSIARKTFLVEQLPAGVLPIYDNKPATGSGYITSQRVTVPEFQIFANPTIKIADVKQRRFNLIDRHYTIKKGYKKITIW